MYGPQLRRVEIMKRVAELDYNSGMRSGNIPFKFDMTDLLARARRQFSKRVGNVTLSLPGISITVSPKDRERQVARPR